MTNAFLKCQIFGLSLLFALMAWSAAIEPQLLTVEKYQVAFPVTQKINIVFLTDLHITPHQQIRLQKIVEKVNGLHPDVVLLGGDFVNGHRRNTSLPIEEIASALGNLKAPGGIFAVLGNHDIWYGEKDIIAALQHHGIHVLTDKNLRLPLGSAEIRLVGTKDFSSQHPDITQAFTDIDKAAIVLTHSPDIFPHLPPTAKLVLAGHNHGGQIYFPGREKIYNKPSKYVRGTVSDGSRLMIVSRGIGTSLLPLRFNSLPEISQIELLPENK